LGRGDHPDAGLGQQLRRGSHHQLLELGFQVRGLGLEEQRLAGAGAQRADRGAVLGAVGGDGAQSRAALELGVGAQPAEVLT
jgi:hypothetical protein